jgi:hypothetical protein
MNKLSGENWTETINLSHDNWLAIHRLMRAFDLDQSEVLSILLEDCKYVSLNSIEKAMIKLRESNKLIKDPDNE